MSLDCESELVTKFPISQEDFRFDGLPRKLPFPTFQGNFSCSSRRDWPHESFRNATNAMTPSRRIDMLARAFLSELVSGAGQRVASQAHNIRRWGQRPRRKGKTEGRGGMKL